ncbi:MAG: hypothetical protein IIZ29_01180 [Schwartzia sp.]|nr:hypothetical protein [Schwartzia sp. (in: firmicutes)]
MSERMTMQEVLKEYGVPVIKLDIHATRTECEALRRKLREASGNGERYLDVSCNFTIDVEDIDRYLTGELDTLSEIYAFPEDITRQDDSDAEDTDK